jgi:hypothetical protein
MRAAAAAAGDAAGEPRVPQSASAVSSAPASTWLKLACKTQACGAAIKFLVQADCALQIGEVGNSKITPLPWALHKT